LEQVQNNQNPNKHSDPNFSGNKIKKPSQESNIIPESQPNMPTTIINNLLNLGPGADPSKGYFY
jgi:hypothetical protein